MLCFRSASYVSTTEQQELDEADRLRLSTSLCMALINNDEAAAHHLLSHSSAHVFINTRVERNLIPHYTISDKIVTRNQLSPLFIAITNSSLTLMLRIIRLGASVRRLSNCDNNALHALCYSSVDIVAKCEYLVRLDETLISGVDKYENQPIHEAAWTGMDDVLTMLLTHGAELDARGDRHRTPLAWAAKRGHVQTLRTLIKRGADVSARDKDDDTPLILSALFGYPACVYLLLQHHADISVGGSNNETAFAWAKRKHHTGTT